MSDNALLEPPAEASPPPAIPDQADLPAGLTAEAASSSGVPLTAHDRCDVKDCGAQAYVRVFATGGPLTFCGHHYAARVEPRIEELGFVVDDQRDRLGPKGKRLDVSA